MFARLLKMHTRTDQIDQAAMIFEESVIPLCKDKEGYRGAYFLADRNTGDCLPVTLWENEKAMQATEESRFFQEQVVKFLDLFTAPPIREAYEVIFKD